MTGALSCVIRRDLKLALRRRADVLTACAFFAIVASLFPLGLGPEPELLRTVAPGVIWVSALLATLLTLPRLFASDYADGTLEQMVLSPSSLAIVVAGKALAHWLVAGLPLTLMSPLLALQYDLRQDTQVVLALSLLAGTPVLSLIGAIGGALTLGLRGGGLLLSLLVLPLYIPVLIVGAGAADQAAAGLDASAHFMLLAALLIIAVVLAPWAASAALQVAVE
jgi:heme exporter protein B